VRLTTFSDYTLRTLICLAIRGPSTIAEISGLYGVSEAHLTKVVHQLGIAGDIETSRGRNGGIRLAKSPTSINVGVVVRRTEEMALVPCFEGGPCLISPACVLREVLNEALAAFLAVLDRYTVADLAGSPALAHLLEKS
jgi:Rrf2 family nitric oxide-sensitive transcriptional repressor